MATTGADIANRITIIGGGWAVKSVTASTYQALSTDNVILVNYAGACDVTLPASPATNQIIIIKDASGAAATNNITVTGTVDGVTNPVIGSNYGGVGIVSNGTNWNQIF